MIDPATLLNTSGNLPKIFLWKPESRRAGVNHCRPDGFDSIVINRLRSTFEAETIFPSQTTLRTKAFRFLVIRDDFFGFKE
jgi:hypothetical protein